MKLFDTPPEPTRLQRNSDDFIVVMADRGERKRSSRAGNMIYRRKIEDATFSGTVARDGPLHSTRGSWPPCAAHLRQGGMTS